MTTRLKLDSNVVELRFAVESSTYKTLGSTPVWYPLDPNSYSDFGGNVSTVARSPIERGRQRRKGVVVDLEAAGSFNIDLTATNINYLLEGFMFAATREKPNAVDWDSTTSPSTFSKTGHGMATTLDAGSIIFTENFADPANNGQFVVASDTVGTIVVTAATLVTEGTAPADSKITHVGHQSLVRSGSTQGFDIDTTTGTWPRLTIASRSAEQAVLDFTDFLVPGEWVFLKGFPDSANNGFKRVRSVQAQYVEFDKSDSAMVDDQGATDSEQQEIYWGHVLKNEDGTEASFPITRFSYHFERDLGEPDDASTDRQYEYLVGSVCNEATFNLGTADKITADLSLLAADAVQFDAGDVNAYRNSGTPSFPDLVDTDVFNTTNDVKRFQMQLVDVADEAPTPLFAHVMDGTIVVNNNLSLAKAISVLGGFEVNVGTFMVSGSLTVYFVDVASVRAVRNNSDVTLDLIMVKENRGMIYDMPLISLGDGRVDAVKDEAIKLPVSYDAAKGSKVNATYTHTLLLGFFPYLPDEADA